jgi:hypothetical protein
LVAALVTVLLGLEGDAHAGTRKFAITGETLRWFA